MAGTHRNRTYRTYKQRAESIEQRYGNEYETAARYNRSIPWLRADRRKPKPVFPFIKAPGDTQVKYDWPKLDALHASPEWTHGGNSESFTAENQPRRGRPKGSKNKPKPKARRTSRASEPAVASAPMQARDNDSGQIV
jgi:hypothetical protein